MRVNLNGIVKTEPEKIRTFNDGSIVYQCYIENKRLSGKSDLIRVTYAFDKLSIGDCVDIIGDVRSMKLNGKDNIYVHAKSLTLISCIDYYKNIVIDSGTLAHPISYRKKSDSSNVMIADMILQENRGWGRNNYIYCSVWGDNVNKCKEFHVQDTIEIVGRLQSRQKDNYVSTEVSILKLRKGDSNNAEGSSEA